MMTLLADLTPVFLTGIVFGALLLCLGTMIGLWLGRRSKSTSEAAGVESQRVAELTSRLSQWTRAMADQVSQYGEVVNGVSQLFRRTDAPLSAEHHEATAGLLAQVVDANEKLRKRLSHAEAMLQEQASDLSTYMSEARTDPLTALPNRRAFDEELARRVAEWRRYGNIFSVLMLDLDHFKRLNDSSGHQAGDIVLEGVARALRETMRESDLIGRIGGEEMAVILPNSDASEARRAAQRAREAIEKATHLYDGRELRVTASVGAARCLEDEDGEQLIKRADEALYAAKQGGRNVAYWHDGIRCQPVSEPTSTHASHPITTLDEAPNTRPNTTADDPFLRVCEDLRRRLDEVTSGSTNADATR